MKICVLGATGRTGKEVVKQALERGHEVTALVRNPGKMKNRHEKLKIMKVDVFNADSMADQMVGNDAVLSCLGVRAALFNLWSITFYSESAKPIVEALRKSGVTRLIYMTSWFTKDDPAYGKMVNCVFKPLFLGEYCRNLEQMEIYMADHCSDIDHTAVRPPRLTNGRSSGKPILTAEDCHIPDGNKSMSRRDVAKFMVDITESGEWAKKNVAITIEK